MNALTMEGRDKKFPMEISQIVKIIWNKNPCRFIENTPSTHRDLFICFYCILLTSRAGLLLYSPLARQIIATYSFVLLPPPPTIGRFPKQSPAQPRRNPSPCRHGDSSALVIGVSQEQVRVLPLFLKIKLSKCGAFLLPFPDN